MIGIIITIKPIPLYNKMLSLALINFGTTIPKIPAKRNTILTIIIYTVSKISNNLFFIFNYLPPYKAIEVNSNFLWNSP
jgi:hypothetical protein